MAKLCRKVCVKCLWGCQPFPPADPYILYASGGKPSTLGIEKRAVSSCSLQVPAGGGGSAPHELRRPRGRAQFSLRPFPNTRINGCEINVMDIEVHQLGHLMPVAYSTSNMARLRRARTGFSPPQPQGGYPLINSQTAGSRFPAVES